MRRFFDILTSRRVSLALMAFVAAFGALGAWIPQSSVGNAEAFAIWQEKNPLVARVADTLGLHDIFSSWWFLGVLAFFGAVLGIATVRMVQTTWRLWRSDGRTPRTALPVATLESCLERATSIGFRMRGEAAGRYVLSRHRLGMWAPSILHIGMLLALVWAALMLGTTTEAIADFSQGQVHEPGVGYYATEDAAPPELGIPWRFDRMDVSTWPSGAPKEVLATFSFLEDGIWTERVSGINHPLRFEGHTIYVQPDEFGDAALLRFTDTRGTEQRIRMEFYIIEDGQPAYSAPIMIGDVGVEGRWDPYGVRDPKPLGLRPAGDDSAEPVTLAPGETVEIAGLTVEFVGTAQWARFIVQRSPSAIPLFIGFGIIALGSLMLYVWIPRELVLLETADGLRYSWFAARMSRSYLSERDAILGIHESEEEGL